MKNSLQSLQNYGQSVWLDYLRRDLLTSGELQRLIEEDGVCGLTSNPSIFEKAIVGSHDYRDLLEAPESQGIEAKTLYERLAVRDIQEAADVLRPVYLASARRDGYVSLEVSPRLAHETHATLEEARHLWRRVARPNVMIKVPGTPEGLLAVEPLISEGINVNVTLLFAQETCVQAAAAYLGGLESLFRQGRDLGQVASVASFFVSRIDTAVDHLIAQRLKGAHQPGEQALLSSLLGKVANASANQVYQKYLEIRRGGRWQELSRHGAQPQRLLWASTGTKNPSYRDVLYVEELIGPETITTLPPATLEAFRDHGRVRPSLTENVEEAISIMDLVAQLGLPWKQLTDKLLAEGVAQFEDAFTKLLKAVHRSARPPDHDPIDWMRVKLMKDLYEGRHHA